MSTEKAQWVVYDGQIYRADHKPAPFTDSEGKHHPDFHDGLVALVYERNHAPLIAAAPEQHRELCRATDLVAVLWAHIPESSRKRVEQDIATRGLDDWDKSARAAIAKATGA